MLRFALAAYESSAAGGIGVDPRQMLPGAPAGKVPVVTGRDVRLVFTKYDGSLHWHQTMRYLGEDEHGIWLGCPGGATAQRGSEPPVRYERHRSSSSRPASGGRPCSTTRQPAPTIYCDISTPARWVHDGEVTMVDLDLDVIRRRDGQVLLDDAGRVRRASGPLRVPAELICQARAGRGLAARGR